MYAAWEAVHGPVAAYDNGKKLPPRFLSGRWISAATFEAKLDSVAGQLPAVFDHCFRAASPSDGAGPALPCDSVAAFVVEDQKEHSKKMGRWRADTSRVLHTEAFWHVIAVSLKSREPLQHLHLFCQSRFADGGRHIRRLVCYRGDKFEN